MTREDFPCGRHRSVAPDVPPRPWEEHCAPCHGLPAGAPDHGGAPGPGGDVAGAWPVAAVAPRWRTQRLGVHRRGLWAAPPRVPRALCVLGSVTVEQLLQGWEPLSWGVAAVCPRPGGVSPSSVAGQWPPCPWASSAEPCTHLRWGCNLGTGLRFGNVPPRRPWVPGAEWVWPWRRVGLGPDDEDDGSAAADPAAAPAPLPAARLSICCWVPRYTVRPEALELELAQSPQFDRTRVRTRGRLSPSPPAPPPGVAEQLAARRGQAQGCLKGSVT